MIVNPSSLYQKRGCPLLQEEEIDQKVEAYIVRLRAIKAPVNSAVVMGLQKASFATQTAIHWLAMEDTF